MACGPRHSPHAGGGGHHHEGHLLLSRSLWRESWHQEPCSPLVHPHTPSAPNRPQPQPGPSAPPTSPWAPTMNTDAQGSSWGWKKQMAGQWVARVAPSAAWSSHNWGETSEGPQGPGGWDLVSGIIRFTEKKRGVGAPVSRAEGPTPGSGESRVSVSVEDGTWCFRRELTAARPEDVLNNEPAPWVTTGDGLPPPALLCDPSTWHPQHSTHVTSHLCAPGLEPGPPGAPGTRRSSHTFWAGTFRSLSSQPCAPFLRVVSSPRLFAVCADLP